MSSYNYTKIRDRIRREVKRACFAPANKFTQTAWRFHILPVVEHSLALGKKLGADLEVLELSALLHDYAGIVDFDLYEEHHRHGAEFAQKLLRREKLPTEMIERIKACILNHRGSVKRNRRSLEERILASADAMSHITELADMFHLTYGVRRLQTETGAIWLLKKLERSWAKTMPEGKRLIAAEWEQARKIVGQALPKR